MPCKKMGLYEYMHSSTSVTLWFSIKMTKNKVEIYTFFISDVCVDAALPFG